MRKPDFLFPVQALSKVFRDKFLAALTRAHHEGDIEHDPQGDVNAWCDRQRQLYKHDWVVYAKTPLDGAAQVLEYLSRYGARAADRSSPVIIRSNKWGMAFNPLSRLPQQAVQSNMVYQPREMSLVSTSIAARQINANR